MSNYKKDKLQINYNKRQKDFIISYPRKCDAHLIHHFILSDVLKWTGTIEGKDRPYDVFNLKEELEKRGYDITTLKFSIELKK